MVALPLSPPEGYQISGILIDQHQFSICNVINIYNIYEVGSIWQIKNELVNVIAGWWLCWFRCRMDVGPPVY
jgi:hypothetical protein